MMVDAVLHRALRLRLALHIPTGLRPSDGFGDLLRFVRRDAAVPIVAIIGEREILPLVEPRFGPELVLGNRVRNAPIGSQLPELRFRPGELGDDRFGIAPNVPADIAASAVAIAVPFRL